MRYLNDIDEFIYLSIEVEQELKQKYLKDLFRSHLLLEGVELSQEDNLYYSYTSVTKRYQLFYISKNSSSPSIIDPLLPLCYYDKKIDGYDLFIFESFFVIFKDGDFYAYKSRYDDTIDDIQLYITQLYEIELNNTILVDDIVYKELKQKCKKRKITYFSLENNISYYSFIIFTCLVTIGFILLYFYGIDNGKQTIKYKLSQKEIEYKKHRYNYSENMIQFFRYAKILHIVIKDLTYTKNSLSTTLFHTNKDTLYQFLSYYKHIKIKSISYDKDKKVCKMDIKIIF